MWVWFQRSFGNEAWKRLPWEEKTHTRRENARYWSCNALMETTFFLTTLLLFTSLLMHLGLSPMHHFPSFVVATSTMHFLFFHNTKVVTCLHYVLKLMSIVSYVFLAFMLFTFSNVFLCKKYPPSNYYLHKYCSCIAFYTWHCTKPWSPFSSCCVSKIWPIWPLLILICGRKW